MMIARRAINISLLRELKAALKPHAGIRGWFRDNISEKRKDVPGLIRKEDLMINRLQIIHSTKTLFTALILSTCFLLLIPGSIAAQRGTGRGAFRIKFMPGAVSAQVRGQLTKDKNREAFFVVNAKAGDHMIVNIISLTPGLATGGGVTSPTGKQDGQHGGIIFNSDLTETGDYRIRVDRNLMGTERIDGAFILEVVITPSYLKG